MKKISIIINGLFVIACVFSMHTRSFAEPANFGQLLTEIKEYHDTGLYSKEIEKTIHLAQQFLDKRVLQTTPKHTTQRLALVLDIDETSLSSYDLMLKRQFVATPEVLYNEFKSAEDTVIEPTLSLYNDAIRHGVAVFFITGRVESLRQATEINLHNAGYANWSGIYFRADDKADEPTATYKARMRSLIEQQGYTIVASIGDQTSDLVGGHAEQTFKLPNPYYFIP